MAIVIKTKYCSESWKKQQWHKIERPKIDFHTYKNLIYSSSVITNPWNGAGSADEARIVGKYQTYTRKVKSEVFWGKIWTDIFGINKSPKYMKEKSMFV